MGKNSQNAQDMNSQAQNPLGTAPVGSLIDHQYAGQCDVQYCGSDFYWTGRGNAGKCSDECGISCYDHCYFAGITAGNRRGFEL